MPQFEFYMPTHLFYGVGSLEDLTKAIAEEQWGRVLVMAGPRVSKTECFQELLDHLRKAQAQVQVFDEVEPDPHAETVERAGRVAVEMRAQCVLGYGGGSNIDAAKAVAVLATNGGRARDHVGRPRYGAPPLPVAAVPTTAGTASEVTYFSVITDVERQEKFVLASSQIAPRLAALDPRVLTSAPRAVLAAAGLDALTHAIESYVSLEATPVTKPLALEAARLIAANLRRLCEDPQDLDAGMGTLLGSNLAGWAFNHSHLGAAHALALPPGARFGVPHGVANAILLPVVMEYNCASAASAYAPLAEAFGVSGGDDAERAAAVVRAVRDLRAEVGLPQRLSEVGVAEEALEAMSQDASKSRHIERNPRKIEPGDLLALYRQAF